MENLIRRRTRTRTTFRSAWRPVSGSKKNAGSDDDVRIWLTGEPSLKLLTEESVCDVVISFSSGRVFQIRAGPATVNARSPTVERLTDGTIRRLVQPERNVRRPGRSATRSGPRYRGALPCKTLYVSSQHSDLVIDPLRDAQSVKAGKSVGDVIRRSHAIDQPCCRI